MDNIEKIKIRIAALQSYVDDIDEMEKPTREQLKTQDDLINQIAELTAKLPRPQARTLQNSRPAATAGNNGGFRNFGEQAQAIVRSSAPGAAVDPRLHSIMAAASGANESVPSEGGFLVQQDFSTALIKGAFDVGNVANRVNRIPISAGANGIKLPMVDETSRATGSRWGGVQSYWLAEADQSTATKPKFRAANLELKKLVGVCYATDELVQDATALEAVLTQAFVEEISFQVDDSIISGTGVGQPLGVLNSAALVSQAAEAGQKAATIVAENVIKMYSRMPSRNRKNAVWYINQGIEHQLFTMSLSVGTGGIPIYMPAGGASGAPYASLFGRPVVPIEQCSALGTVGDIIFMDPTAYILIDKGGVQSEMSIHVRFLWDEQVFRFIYRCDGQPAFASAITPYGGGSTLSPYVALATRS